jgi:hypothetical protein
VVAEPRASLSYRGFTLEPKSFPGPHVCIIWTAVLAGRMFLWSRQP